MKPKWIYPSHRRPKGFAPLWLLALTIVLFASISAAMMINVLPAEHISLYSNRIANSNFTLDNQQVFFLGDNRILITLELTNTQTDVQQANVTVTLLDASGNALLNLTELTGDVSGNANVHMWFLFSEKGITMNYASDMIQVTDVKP